MSMWRNGRRARLRGVWRNLWGFKSPHRQLKTKRLNASIVFNKRMVRTRTLFRVQRPVSRVRRTFAKRTKFFEAKSVDTFNANRSRQVPPTTLLNISTKRVCIMQINKLSQLNSKKIQRYYI